MQFEKVIDRCDSKQIERLCINYQVCTVVTVMTSVKAKDNIEKNWGIGSVF